MDRSEIEKFRGKWVHVKTKFDRLSGYFDILEHPSDAPAILIAEKVPQIGETFKGTKLLMSQIESIVPNPSKDVKL